MLKPKLHVSLREDLYASTPDACRRAACRRAGWLRDGREQPESRRHTVPGRHCCAEPIAEPIADPGIDARPDVAAVSGGANSDSGPDHDHG